MSWPLADPTWIARWALDPRSLAVARIGFAVYLLTVVDLEALAFVGALPADLWTPPPGPMRVVASPPGPGLMRGLIASIEILAVLVAFGWQTRATSIALGLAFALASGLSFGTGKVNHDLLLWLTPLMMSGQWGRARSVDALAGRGRDAVEPVVLACFAIMVGFCMFSAGLPKLLGGWLDPRTPATYGHLVRNFYVAERTRGLASAFLSIRSPLFWEPADWLTVAWEIGFLFAVARPRWFRAFIAYAVVFHALVLLIFNIDFSANLVAYAVFVPWVEGDEPGSPTIDERRARWWLAAAVATAAVLVLVPSPLMLLRDAVGLRRLPGAVAVIVAVLVVAVRGVGQARRWLLARRARLGEVG